jgi:alpha-galactosidase
MHKLTGAVMVWCAGAFAAIAGQDGTAFYAWARTPPMGWNSWDSWGCTATEEIVKANADYMAAALAKHGWQYIVVDIQWYEPQSRGFDYDPHPKVCVDRYGRLLPVPVKFPSASDGRGFKPLADYIHGKGLKFGLHLLRGIPRAAVEANAPIEGCSHTAGEIADRKSLCAWNPDMFGVDMSKPGAQEYYDSVFRLMASWDLDFVKVDDLSAPYHTPEIEGIRRAIDRCGRPIVFSTSPGDTPLGSGDHVSTHANMWRISGDFWDDWSALKHQFERLDRWTPYRGEGHWPDADMLPLGNIRAMEKNGWTHFTADEQRTLMTLWCIARSPLMMGGHLPKNDEFTLSLLANQEVLAVNQSSGGNRQLFRTNDTAAWVAQVPGSRDQYLALFNLGEGAQYDASRAAWRSGLLTRDTPGHAVDVDVNIGSARVLALVVDDGGDTFACDHADWAEPRLTGPAGTLKLTELKWRSGTCGWGSLSGNKSVSGAPLTIDGKAVSYGIGTHANSVIVYDIPEGYTRLEARAGLDDGGTKQSMAGSTAHFMVFTGETSEAARKGVRVVLADMGITGPCTVQDLWTHRDLGSFRDAFEDALPAHGSGLYRVSPK